MTPAVRLCVPTPNLTVEPVPMRTVSHPVTSANPPENPRKLSVSLPSPPLTSAPPVLVVKSMDAPAKTSIRSVPDPNDTSPEMVAPDFTISTESPSPSEIAFLVEPRASTDAPLSSVMVTPVPDGVSVVMAEVKPLAVPDTTMAVSPVPSLSTRIPAPSVPLAMPDTDIEMSPSPDLASTRMPALNPRTLATLTVASPPDDWTWMPTPRAAQLITPAAATVTAPEPEAMAWMAAAVSSVGCACSDPTCTSAAVTVRSPPEGPVAA